MRDRLLLCAFAARGNPFARLTQEDPLPLAMFYLLNGLLEAWHLPWADALLLRSTDAPSPLYDLWGGETRPLPLLLTAAAQGAPRLTLGFAPHAELPHTTHLPFALPHQAPLIPLLSHASPPQRPLSILIR